MLRRRRLVCSFCGKGEAGVAKLVAGPRVYICDQCVALASQIMAGHAGDAPQVPEPQRGLLRRVLNRLGRALHWGVPRSRECHAVGR